MSLKPSQQYNYKSMCVFFGLLTIFFEASKASLLEMVCVLNPPAT